MAKRDRKILMKKFKYAAMAILLFSGLFLGGCGSDEDPAKAEMRSKAGINGVIEGDYDETLAAVCNNGTFVGVPEGSVISYKGIPFAEPPVGELRWKDPVPAKDRDGVYEAAYFGKSPIQSEWFSEVGSYYLQGEDCLTLNVWTNPEGPAEGKTVMVFFHGGSYGWGGTSDPLYDGHNLVEKYPDLVLVTAEYRTGIMGFIDFSDVPGGEDYSTSGNLGLLDQVCALEWVKKNIGAFGGDPENVTIFGESAGAGSVSLLPLIEGTDGLFKRIIMESGSPAFTYSREECRSLTEKLLKSSGCSDMAQLAALDEETLMELNEDLNDYNNFPERDGVVLPEDLYGAWESGALEGIDVLSGTNRDEARYWIREMGNDIPAIIDVLMYKIQMTFMYENNLKRLSSEEKALVNTFLRNQSGPKVWKLTEFYNELLFRVPALEMLARHKGNSYNYYWTMPCESKKLGACHAVELAYVFNNPQADIYTGGLFNEKLADTVQDMWVNFARTGDPGTKEYTWEPYTADSRKTMVLGDEIGMTADLLEDQRERIQPLMHHYFNGCYTGLDLMVPELWRIIGVGAAVLALIVVCICLIVKALRKRRKKKGR